MSGVIMARVQSGIIMLSDGGLYESTSDFTMVGQACKISKYTHLSALMTSVGKAKLRLMIDNEHSADWKSFDHMVSSIKGDASIELDRYVNYFGEPAFALLAFAGWSDEREHFESYTLLLDGEEVREVEPAPEV
jgi:hypothetical protein